MPRTSMKRRQPVCPWISWSRAGAAVLLALSVAGCSTVPVSQQRLVSKPNMLFSNSSVYAYTSRVLPQTQPGLMDSGGTAGSVCTACQ